MRQQCFVLLVVLQQGFSLFYIKKVDPSLVVVAPGETVSLFCETNGHYEYCKFISPQQKICDFEWKRSEGNITMQECDQSLLDKKVGRTCVASDNIDSILIVFRCHSMENTMTNNVE